MKASLLGALVPCFSDVSAQRHNPLAAAVSSSASQETQTGLSYDTCMHTHRSASDGCGLSGLRLTPQMGDSRLKANMQSWLPYPLS